jgi:hypothetical protein
VQGQANSWMVVPSATMTKGVWRNVCILTGMPLMRFFRIVRTRRAR